MTWTKLRMGKPWRKLTGWRADGDIWHLVRFGGDDLGREGWVAEDEADAYFLPVPNNECLSRLGTQFLRALPSTPSLERARRKVMSLAGIDWRRSHPTLRRFSTVGSSDCDSLRVRCALLWFAAVCMERRMTVPGCKAISPRLRRFYLRGAFYSDRIDALPLGRRMRERLAAARICCGRLQPGLAAFCSEDSWISMPRLRWMIQT